MLWLSRQENSRLVQKGVFLDRVKIVPRKELVDFGRLRPIGDESCQLGAVHAPLVVVVLLTG